MFSFFVGLLCITDMQLHLLHSMCKIACTYKDILKYTISRPLFCNVHIYTGCPLMNATMLIANSLKWMH